VVHWWYQFAEHKIIFSCSLPAPLSMSNSTCHSDGAKQGRRSLHVTEKDGRARFYCFASCDYRAIMQALGVAPSNNGNGDHRQEPEATYNYRDRDGKLLYQVVRFPGKDFKQRRPDGKGGWIWNLKGVKPTLYRLPETQAAVQKGEPVFIPEGERDVDKLVRLGLVATTNSGGAGKWDARYADYLAGADVVILPDNDEPGRKHADQVGCSLQGKAKSIKVVELPGLPDKGDVSDWFAKGGTKEKLFAIIQETTPLDRADLKEVTWEEPLRLSEFDPPAFPIDALPSWLRSFVEAAATSLQIPVDMPGALALTACGAAVAGKFIVQITPDWKEPLVIQVLLVMFSGERKTAALTEILAPIEAYERELAVASRGEIARQKGQKEILEQRLKTAQNAAAKAKGADREGKEEEAANLAQDLANLEIKAPPRLIVDDASPEKIASLLCEQNGRLALFSAEGGIFDTISGRYTSNGTANFDVFLKGHAGDPIRVDRIGRPPEFVKSPALTIGMTVQPDVLSGLFEKPSFRGRGLLARFLYSQPRSLMGHRQTNPTPVPPHIKRDYFECLQKLLGLTPGTDERGDQAPNVLHLSAEAQQLSREFASWLEPKLEPVAGELSFMADWAGKLHGAIIRMAGILHLAPMPEGWSSPISGDTFARAVRLGKYFLEHAKGTFGEMGANQEITDAKYLLNWITKSQASEFKKQDCWQSTRGYFREAKRLDATLDLLVEYGHIQQQETEGKKPGRPGSVYEVNPLSSRDSRLKVLDQNLDPLLFIEKPDTAQDTAHDSDLISWTV
jgi:hypothetical protein